MRRRIVASTLAVTAAGLILFGVPFGWALGRVYRSQQLTRLQAAATAAAVAVPAGGLRGPDPIEPPMVARQIRLGYYDGRGVLAAGVGPTNADAQLRRALGGRSAEGKAGSRLVVAVPITANENTVGAVEASSASSAVLSRTARSWLAMLVLGLAALAIAGGIATWQGRRLAGPVDDLVAGANQLGVGDFGLRAPRSGIAELDRAAQALEATSARLGELMDRERAFTAHASHQLRTPLTALRLELETALQTPGVDMGRAVADAVGEVDRLQNTLEQLLALARTGSAPSQQVPLADILTPFELRWHPVLAEQGRRLNVVADDSLRPRLAPSCLAQILDILVDNATIHGRGTVGVAAESKSGWVSVGVEDEGGGMAALPDGLPVGAAAANRHGLGLRLARSLAEAAGGRLVLTRPGPRPMLTVLLP
jgi:signal transduction histidine kinase